MTYCIDTSALIAAWNERYPIENFPPFWERLDDLIRDGRLCSPRDVKEEIIKKEDGLYSWLDERPQMFVELEEDIQQDARVILAEFPLLTKQIEGRNPADPFVIALAKARGCTVITQEGMGSPSRPRIPLVCKYYGIKCMDILGLVREENWVI